MSTPAAALPVPGGAAGFRDRPTALIAAVAVIALAVVPWAASGGASALALAASGAKWPHYAATLALGPLFLAAVATLIFGWIGVAIATRRLPQDSDSPGVCFRASSPVATDLRSASAPPLH